MVFCNSVYSGALILGGLFVGDQWLGTCSAISLAVRRPAASWSRNPGMQRALNRSDCRTVPV